MPKWVYRVSDGQWCLKNGPDPAAYNTDQVNYGLATLPDSSPVPNPRTEKWDGSANVVRTQSEIDAFDALEKAKLRDKELGLKMIKALAIAVHKRIKRVVPTDATTAAEWEAAIRAEWDALN